MVSYSYHIHESWRLQISFNKIKKENKDENGISIELAFIREKKKNLIAFTFRCFLCRPKRKKYPKFRNHLRGHYQSKTKTNTILTQTPKPSTNETFS